MITLFGTCRLNKISGHTNLNTMINFTHSTKEVIQMIQFIQGVREIPAPYDMVCFRTGIMQRTPIEYSPEFRTLFEQTDTFIVEICSRKKYVHGGYYLHHLCVDMRKPKHHHVTPADIMAEYTVEHQSDSEIEQDLIEIQSLLYPKRMIVVSHYNSKIHGKYIDSRDELIRLLQSICETHQIPFVNPTEVLKQFPQEDVMKTDLAHYTDVGLREFSQYMDQYV